MSGFFPPRAAPRPRLAPAAWQLVLALALLQTLFACGKKGDPLPPLRPTPGAVAGLRVAQRGDRLEVEFTAPRASTDGLRLPVLDLELMVADKEGDFLKVARVRTLKAAPGEVLRETEPLPPPGTLVRVAVRAIAKGHRGSLGEPARLLVAPPLVAPRDLEARLASDGVRLTWQGEVPAPLAVPEPEPKTIAPSPTERTGETPGPPAPTGPPAGPPAAAPIPPPPDVPTPVTPAPATASPDSPGAPARPSAPAAPSAPKPPPFAPGFFIYKRAPQGRFEAPLSTTATVEPSYVDRSVAPGESWCYEVRAVASATPRVESGPTAEACLDIEDIVAPAAPVGVAALPGPEGIELSWSASAEPDLAGYRVYRALPGVPPVRLRELRPEDTTFLDTDAPPAERVVYTLTAFDRAGNESPPSAPTPARRP